MEARGEGTGARRDERSLGQLFGDLQRQLATLVRQEIDLARTEMTSKAKSAGRGVALVAAGGAALYAAFLGLMAAIALGLATLGLDLWLAALIVALVVGGVGAFLVYRGREDLQVSPVPEKTLDTLKDDADWAKERVK
jgi:hypothetical protein